MHIKTSLVITSISKPNEVLKQISKGCTEHQVNFILVGDKKSPDDFSLPGCNYYSLEQQKKSSFKFAKLCPENHYARKNIGYLLAMRNDSEIIIETDDDNIPLNSFWGKRDLRIKSYNISKMGWMNVYKYFTENIIWPRGFPLDAIHDEMPTLSQQKICTFVCPIQQGLADENPDVDAIFRLIMPLPQNFEKNRSVILSDETWCPFNSQNTTWFKEAFALMYLPSYCSFRMTDIWRSFIAQRIAWTNDWGILYHAPTVYQRRNVHNLIKDFNDDIPGYLHNRKICEILQGLSLRVGKNYISENLLICYEGLVSHSFFDNAELDLLNTWIEDIKSNYQ